MFLRCMLNTVIEQPWAVALMKLKWRTTHFTEGRKDPRTRCCTSLTFSPNEIIFYRDDFERNSLTPQWTKTCSSKWIIGHGRLQKAYEVKKTTKKTAHFCHRLPQDTLHPFCFLTKQNVVLPNFSMENPELDLTIGKTWQYFTACNTKWLK